MGVRSMNSLKIEDILEQEYLFRKNLLKVLDCDELVFLISKGDLKAEIEIIMEFKECPCD